MRVALDATPLTLSSGGLRRYTEQLSLALAKQFPGDDYAFIGDRAFPMPQQAPSNLNRGPEPQNAIDRRWWLFGAAKAMARLDSTLFHGTNFEVPYWNARPSVLTLHDLSPWKNPAWHSGADRVRLRTPWLLRMGIATMVIVPTEAIRKEAIARFGIAPERIAAVYEGVTEFEIPTKAPAPDRPYLLFVGTLEPRKNVPALIAAWRELRETHPVDLVVAGRRRDDGPSVAEEPGLLVTGEVTDAELGVLYQNAFAFVYPSQYEGFGLPVLEAMRAGAVAVIGNDPALIEIGGKAAVRVDSHRALVGALRELLTNPALAEEYREQGRRRAALFSWAQTAKNTRAVYGEAIARFG